MLPVRWRPPAHHSVYQEEAAGAAAAVLFQREVFCIFLLKLVVGLLNNSFWTSGQDGGIGRHTLFPCTSIGRITTNLKIKNTQNCQKMELHGSLATKDLKKPYSSRQVGEEEMGTGAERMQCGSGVVLEVAGGMGSLMSTCGG